jgi:undecaprenyl-diphosphatase
MVARWDRAIVEAFQHAHWGPANWVFEQLSEWWVRGLVIIGVGLLADLRLRRFPTSTVVAVGSYFAASGITELLKRAFERPRPSVIDPAVHPLVAVPHSFSMPSGHAATAFAAAVAVALFHPRLRGPLVGLAVLVAVSRVWLGVHYLSDVLAGAAIGTAVAVAGWLAIRLARLATAWFVRASPAGEAGSGRHAPPAPSESARRGR